MESKGFFCVVHLVCFFQVFVDPLWLMGFITRWEGIYEGSSIQQDRPPRRSLFPWSDMMTWGPYKLGFDLGDVYCFFTLLFTMVNHWFLPPFGKKYVWMFYLSILRKSKDMAKNNWGNLGVPDPYSPSKWSFFTWLTTVFLMVPLKSLEYDDPHRPSEVITSIPVVSIRNLVWN